MNKRQKEHKHRTLSWQVRQAVLQTVQTHIPLDIQARSLDALKAWDILIYASVTGTSIENACNTCQLPQVHVFGRVELTADAR